VTGAPIIEAVRPVDRRQARHRRGQGGSGGEGRRDDEDAGAKAGRAIHPRRGVRRNVTFELALPPQAIVGKPVPAEGFQGS
jgi:hypothetical protein